MADLEIEVRGLRELTARMRGLAPKIANRAVTQALRQAGRPMLQAVRAAAPVAAFSTTARRAGTVKRNIRLRILRPRPGRLDPGVSIGVRATRSRTKSRAQALTRLVARRRLGVRLGKYYDDPFYWYFLEHGWTSRRGNKFKREFLRPAFGQHAARFLSAFRDALGPRIEQAWRTNGG